MNETQANEQQINRPKPDQQKPDQWPDPLDRPTAQQVATLLADFWQQLEILPDLILRKEHLLAAEAIHALRQTVLRMMLALNGIQRPPNTRHLNTYLSASQRRAIQRTLLTPDISQTAWVSQAVSLVVIYRWYAPQLAEAYTVSYPQQLEDQVWQLLCQRLPTWPRTVTSGE